MVKCVRQIEICRADRIMDVLAGAGDLRDQVSELNGT